MKHSWGRMVLMSAIRLIGLTLLIWLLTIGWSRGDGVPPTTEWVNIYSQNSEWAGNPLSEGSVVAVFRPDGSKCGEVVVKVDGWYGLLPCYRDPAETGRAGTLSMASADTANRDGSLTFTIDGEPVEATPVSLNGSAVPTSTLITWTSMGDLWEVDLQGWPPVGGYSMPSGTAACGRVLTVIGRLIALCAAGFSAAGTLGRVDREN